MGLFHYASTHRKVDMISVPTYDADGPRLPEDGLKQTATPVAQALIGATTICANHEESWVITPAHQIVQVLAHWRDVNDMVRGRPGIPKFVEAYALPRDEALKAVKVSYQRDPDEIDALKNRLDYPESRGPVRAPRSSTAASQWLG